MKRWIWLSALVAGLAGALVGRAGTLVQFRTVFGDMAVELYDQEKPATVQNFLRYVAAGAYRDSFFHRLVPNFVLQGGGYAVTNRGSSNVTVFDIPTFPPITNEFALGPLLSNTIGTIAMAKTTNANSATSQFFINLTNNAAALDDTNNSGGFTVFGRVVQGTNIFKTFNTFATFQLGGKRRTNAIVNIRGTPFTETPFLIVTTNTTVKPPQDFYSANDVVFVDITTLRVSVRGLDSGGREISWDGVQTGTNVVEYTTVFPPQWQTLETLVKPENPRPVVLDPSGDDLRFYRVRVDF